MIILILQNKKVLIRSVKYNSITKSSFLGDELLTTFNNSTKKICLKQCTSNQYCRSVSLSSNKSCQLFSSFINSQLKNDSASTVFFNNRPPKTGTVPAYLSSYLSHYWPINNDLKDHAGSGDILYLRNATMDRDRFGNQNSSLYLNFGYFKVGPDVYFNASDFTVMGWIKPLDLFSSPNSVFFAFLNNVYTDQFYVSYGSAYKAADVYSFNGVNTTYNMNFTYLSSTAFLRANDWNHLAVVQKNSTLLVYLNGSLSGKTFNFYPTRHVIRNLCYFGSGYWNTDAYAATAYFDDIQLYGKGLDQSEIQDIFYS